VYLFKNSFRHASQVLFMENQLNLFELNEPNLKKRQTPPAHLQRKIKRPKREQIEFKIESLDDALEPDHQARTIWNFIELLDFSRLYEKYYSLSNGLGRGIVDPKILVALWLYAICDGVISARKIAKYCNENKAYAWICGGVSVGHHLLSGFRSDFSELFDEFVVQSISLLYDKGLIQIKSIAQDGTKLQASARAMHRKNSLVRKAFDVRKHIKNLEKELQSGHFEKEQKKKKERELIESRKKKDRLIQAAKELQKHKEVLNENRSKSRKAPLSNKDISKLRASPTDPECRKMKMADKSCKPAYNVQIATDVDTDLVLKVRICQNSNDGGELLPMYSSLRDQYGLEIDSYLVDSAFRNRDDFAELFDSGCKIYCPTKKKKTAALRKRILSGNYEKDTQADIDWVLRMEEAEAGELYNRRIRASETINAFFTNHGIHQLLVRGTKKVKGFIDLACLAYNMLTIKRLYNLI